ncbi:MAG: DUF3347 domain-containing protein [Candidatus Dadabacteria bacterium]
MRGIIIFLIIVGIAIIAWLFLGRHSNPETPKGNPIKVSKHSAAFNESIDSALNSYYAITAAFVQWDSTLVEKQAGDLRQRLSTLKLDELKKDSSGILETAQTFVENAQNDVTTIEQEHTITAKRRALNSLTDNIFNLLRVVRFDRNKLFLQECPMAFNDEEPGDWISKSPEVINPYLGIHHPRYGKGMLHCGETKDTLNFTEEK